MKTLLASILVVLALAAPSLRAASDADVTLIKATKVVIEDNIITIVAEATTSITLIRKDHVPGYQGDTWQGRPVSRVQVKSDKATFVIKRSFEGVLDEAWKMSLQAAKDLQEGREVGRIGYYAPEMIIKGNLITSISGAGFLYSKGK